MIYILDIVELENNKKDIIEKILDILNIEYKKLYICQDKLEQFISSKEYGAVFLSLAYSETLKKIFKKDFSKYEGIDYIINDNDNIKVYSLLYKAFKNLIINKNIDFNNKTILILGSSKESKTIYEAIKNISNPTIYIASITEEVDNKLRAGDRKIRKIEISNLNYVDCIINTTELGNNGNINSSMLDDKNLLDSKMAIDLIYSPSKTKLLRYYEMNNAVVYSGLLIKIYEIIYALSKYYKKDMYDKVDEIYNKIIMTEE